MAEPFGLMGEVLPDLGPAPEPGRIRTAEQGQERDLGATLLKLACQLEGGPATGAVAGDGIGTRAERQDSLGEVRRQLLHSRAWRSWRRTSPSESWRSARVPMPSPATAPVAGPPSSWHASFSNVAPRSRSWPCSAVRIRPGSGAGPRSGSTSPIRPNGSAITFTRWGRYRTG